MTRTADVKLICFLRLESDGNVNNGEVLIKTTCRIKYCKEWELEFYNLYYNSLLNEFGHNQKLITGPDKLRIENVNFKSKLFLMNHMKQENL